MPDLVIITVSYNTRGLLRRCLSALRPHWLRLAAQVVVVDNASGDGSAAMVSAEFPEVTLIANPGNVGFAKASNQAIAATDSRYLLLLNSDAFLVGDAAERLRAGLEANPQAAAAGPRMCDGQGRVLASAHAFESLPRLAGSALHVSRLLPERLLDAAAPLLGRAGGQHLLNYQATCPVNVDWVSGACMLVRRSAAERVGLLDEGFFMYMEDEDWCRRFRQAGYEVLYLPQAEAIHYVARSSGGGLQSALRYRKSRLRYHRRYHPRLYPAFWLLANCYTLRQGGVAGLVDWVSRRRPVGMPTAGIPALREAER